MAYLILISTFIFMYLIYLLMKMRRPKDFPPGPNWLPFIGNAPELRKLAKELGGQHKAYERWFEIYKSPLIGFKLGNQLMVVAMNYEMVKSVNTGDEFLGRPDNFFLRLRTMGTRLGITCTDGDLWREQRCFAIQHLRDAGYGRAPMDIQIQKELKELLDIINEHDGKSIWPGSLLPPSVINVLWTLAAGKRIPRNDERLERLLTLLNRRSKAFDISGSGLLSQFPWLRYIAPEKTGYNLIKSFNKDLHELFMETVNEHHRTYTEEKSIDDLIYAYIKEMRQRKGEKSTFTDIQLTMIILDIFIAGSQTTSTTIDLALMMMVLYPNIQKKIQEEIDFKLIKDKLPNKTDRILLPYTDSFLREVQRFFHIIPIAGPRRTLNNTTLGGYFIPKNTIFLTSSYNVHMDKDYWGDPENFRPERFLNDDMKSIKKTEQLIVFGQGKRKCLGDTLARDCIFTFFVGILQKYNLILPDDTDAYMPSIKTVPGIVLTPKPYKIIFNKR